MPEGKKSIEKLGGDVPLAHIKVKQEKIDPEVEAKINAISITNVKIKRESDKEKRSTQTNVNKLRKTGDDNISEPGESDENSSADDDDENSNDKERSPDEDKKSIEPVKSSNEILAELFKVFNAAPPEELLNDENLLKKSHKHKKVKKEKKKKIKREKDVSAGERSNSSDSDASNDDNDGKHKHKRKHKKKKKHKDEKDKGRDRSKDRGKKDKDIQKGRSRSTEKTKEHLRKPSSVSASLDLRRESKSQKRHSDFHGTESTSAKRSRLESEHKSHHSRSHDRSRERDKYNERDREKDDKHRIKERDKDSSEGHKSKERKHNSFYNGYSQYEASTKGVKVKQELKEKPIKNEKEDGQISEVSLSDDEEDYLRERHKSSADSKRRDRFAHDNNSTTDRSRNSYYAGSKYDSRSRDRDRDREREREREKNYRGNGAGSRNNTRRSRSRGRDRSRSRSRDLGIDKKRLLEIARKNAISMFKRGSLPGCDGMSEEVKDKVLLKMRYGGKTVQDLTDFCKKISNGENLSDLSSDEDSDVDKSGNAKAFHHPFQLKEREPIVMHIRNSTKLPLRPTPSETVKAITMQFPVSSGQEHRRTEEWVPVVPKESLPPLPALPAATQSTTIFKTNVVKNVFEKPIPEEKQQEPAFKPVQTNQVAPTSNTTQSTDNEAAVASTTVSTTSAVVPTAAVLTAAVLTAAVPTAAVAAATADKPSIDTSKPFYAVPQPSAQAIAALNPATTIAAPPASALPVPPQNFVPDVPVPSSMCNINNSIFPEHTGAQIDVSSIISKRLQAMRRLQENPMDPEAIKMMYNSQKDMSSWASSKHIPGQFTGSTGANILSTRELNSGPQAWARRDQLTTTRPVSGGMGMQLLQKMGWKPGEGLGRDKSGSLQPLLLDVKLDKHGLVARDDNTGGYNSHKQRLNRKPRPQNMEQHKQSLTDKHPVCLLNELTSKRKWTPPLYTLTNEAGPSHSKMFLFSVSINGQIYTPPQGSNTKKEAKLISARYCLQQMGILPSQ